MKGIQVSNGMSSIVQLWGVIMTSDTRKLKWFLVSIKRYFFPHTSCLSYMPWCELSIPSQLCFLLSMRGTNVFIDNLSFYLDSYFFVQMSKMHLSICHHSLTQHHTTHIISYIDICILLNQKSNDLAMAIACCNMQRRLVIL